MLSNQNLYDKQTYCIFSAQYLPHMGGVENYTYHLSQELIRLGNRVIIITCNTVDLENISYPSSNLTVVRLPCYPLLDGRFPLLKKNTIYKKLINDVIALHIDNIVINTRFYPLSLQAAKLAKKKGIRPILIEHGSAYLTLGNRIIDFFIKKYEHAITYIIKQHPIDFYGVSKASSKWLKTFGIQSKGELNNAINATKFRESASKRDFRKELNLPQDAFVVSFTGRFIPEKGIPALLRAADSLSNNSSIHFFLAGDGPLKPEIEQKNLKNVHLLGKLSPEDVAAMLLTSDAFCLPTRSEGFSTSLLEAAACETTPIITNVGGAEELISSKEYGFLLKNSSSECITASILYLLNHKTECKKMAKQIYNKVSDRFKWSVTTDALIRACEETNTSAK